MDELERKAQIYINYLKAKDPRAAAFVEANRDDRLFMLYVRTHAAICTGLFQGMERARRDSAAGCRPRF